MVLQGIGLYLYVTSNRFDTVRYKTQGASNLCVTYLKDNAIDAATRAFKGKKHMNDDFQASWTDQATMNTTTTDATPRAPSSLPLKQIVTIRLDIDMLNWFKAAGPGYQTRINQILREHMEAERAGAKE
jgi:uncharacterized protein (DUF4415 family)